MQYIVIRPIVMQYNVIPYNLTIYGVIPYNVIVYNVIRHTVVQYTVMLFCVRKVKCCYACPVTRITALCGTRADVVAIPIKNPYPFFLCFEDRQPR